MKRKASKSKRATMERPLLVTDVRCSTEHLLDIGWLTRLKRQHHSLHASVPSEEVVLLCLRHVVCSGCSKAVIQQDVETARAGRGVNYHTCFKIKLQPGKI